MSHDVMRDHAESVRKETTMNRFGKTSEVAAVDGHCPARCQGLATLTGRV